MRLFEHSGNNGKTRSSRGLEQFPEEAVAPLACPTHGMGGSGAQRSRRVVTNLGVRYYDHDPPVFQSLLSWTPQVWPQLYCHRLRLHQLTSFTNCHWHSYHHGTIVIRQHIPIPMYRHLLRLSISISCQASTPVYPTTEAFGHQRFQSS